MIPHFISLQLRFCLHLRHHFLSCALRTDDVPGVLDETLANHGDLADGAEEAAVVPGQLLEGNELGAAQTSFSYVWK